MIRKVWYVSVLLVLFLVGCNDVQYIESVAENFNDVSLENNIDDKKDREIGTRIQFPKNAIVSGDATFMTESGEEMIVNLSKIQLLGEDNEYYLTVHNGVSGKIKKENVMFFEVDMESSYTLMLDISQFNKDSKFYSFHTDSELGKFVIQNKINYLYIRLGGRGYGQKGVLYTDSQTEFYAKACDYFGIPYGFYFLDEALNEAEAIEEADFIKNYLKGKNFEMNRLPIAIDVEYAYGKGRADNSWNTRIPIINRLIDELSNEGYGCILYANGARIDTYIKDVNCNFWTAMYPKQNMIPKGFYDDTVKEEERKILANPNYLKDSILSIDINMADTNKVEYSDEYLKKVKAWQFTEDGASQNGIEGLIDLSLVDNLYFFQFCN